MKSSTLYRWLEWTFQPQTCTEVFPVIGLQEDNTEEITRVYTATFASPEVFEQLERLDANTCMLFTHHPKPQRMNTADPPPQIPQKWLDFLKERHISLFTYHIPLDRNSPFSPGVNLARALGAEPYDSFFEQNLVRMGVVCTSPFSTATELAQAMERIASFDILSPDGIMVAESPLGQELPALPAPYSLYREYRYGKIKVSIYHRAGEEEA